MGVRYPRPNPLSLSHRMEWNVVVFERATRGREGGRGAGPHLFGGVQCSHQIEALFTDKTDRLLIRRRESLLEAARAHPDVNPV